MYPRLHLVGKRKNLDDVLTLCCDFDRVSAAQNLSLPESSPFGQLQQSRSCRLSTEIAILYPKIGTRREGLP